MPSMKCVALLITLFCVLGLRTGAQPAPITPELQEVEDQAKQLLEQAAQPNFDFGQFRDQARGLMQQFQEITQDMDPQKVADLRQQMMEHLQPSLDKAMPNLIKGAQLGMLDNIKQALGCTDDEFAALRPLLQRIMEDMMALNQGGPGRGPGGRGPFGGGNNFAEGSAAANMQAARSDLERLVKDTTASPNELRQKLDIFRGARDRTRQELQDLRSQLTQLLTVRQESILMNMGVLE